MCENMCTLNLFDGRLEANEDWGTCSCVCDVCVWLAMHTEAVFCFFVFVLFFPSDKTV